MSPADYADYGLKIAEEFQRYLKTGDKKFIDKYSARQLRSAISKLSPFYGRNKLWFREIERRMLELTNDEQLQRKRDGDHFKYLFRGWIERIVTFGFGILFGVLI